MERSLCTTNLWILLRRQRFWWLEGRRDDDHRDTENTEKTGFEEKLPFSVISVPLWSVFGFGCSERRCTTNQWSLPARRFEGWEAGEAFTTETPRGTERVLRDLCVSVVWVWFFSWLRREPRCDSVTSVSLW